ncbi:MAG: PepSY domain-containing protein [Gammaproteobacteria bacterium]|nr:PepSY domain-containing protein [Gammaproteobacteria bacterium]
MKFKTALYLSHRWLGIGMCLLIAMWFATGMVMMYVGFPELTKKERYAGLATLNPETIHFSSAALLAGAPQGASVERLILTSVAERPLYLLKLRERPWRGMYADTGLPLTALPADAALASAVNFYRHQYPEGRVQAHYLRTLDMDQWTVSSGLSAHRPLHLVSFDDQVNTHLYVSSRTGQVVRDTTRRERVWNWLGANLHWIYPLQLRKHTNLWVNLIIILSSLGLVTIITGGIIGFLRLRFRRPYRGKSVTPYRGMSKYHHFLGLGSLVFMTTFMFSGLMSMSPWGLFDASSNFTEQVKRYQLNDDLVRSEPAYSRVGELRRLLGREPHVAAKELVWHWINGASHLTSYSGGEPLGHEFVEAGGKTLESKVQQRIAKLIPDAEVVAQHRLNDYDTYYYSHHERFRPLPILRVKFSDQEATWFHIDLSTGEVLGRSTYKGRVQRWLYNGLHSLDFAVLINHRPLWDILVLTLCSIGLVFSVTSVVLGWRRLIK